MTTVDHAEEVESIHAEIRAIHASDRGCGATAENDFKLSKLLNRLRVIRDEQHGLKPDPLRYSSEPAKPRKKPNKAKKPHVFTGHYRCYCSKHAFNAGGPLPKPHKAVHSVAELCHECQVRPLFLEAVRDGKHPADLIPWHLKFEPSGDDRSLIERICWMRRGEWLPEARIEADDLMTFIAAYRAC